MTAVPDRHPASAGRRATPALVALVRAGVDHEVREYTHGSAAGGYGDEVVAALGLDPAAVGKTLVAEVDGRLTMAVVPVAGRLDLKALAAAVGGKRAVMADLADAERVTGSVAGAISPLGQRRPLPTVVDSSVLGGEVVHVSAGRRGLEVSLAPADLVRLTGAVPARISAS